MYMKKLRTPEWLKTSTFSCNTSVKLCTNGTRTLLKLCPLLTFCDVFSCILFTSNHKISLALRARRASAILLPLKKLLVLINTKYCTWNHVMTYTYSSVWVKSKEGWYQWQWPGFWQSHHNNIIATRVKKQCLPAMTWGRPCFAVSEVSILEHWLKR